VTCSAVSVRVSPSSSGYIPGPASEAVLNPDACVGCSGGRNGTPSEEGAPTNLEFASDEPDIGLITRCLDVLA
jgi:hypothetical protein